MSVVALLAVLAATATASAAPKRITGKLSQSHLTVIALGESGAVRSDAAEQGKFRLRPPARRVTLHLRATDGTYAGPIVIDRTRNGKRAIVGVKAGAKLGEVKVKRRQGYAKLSGGLPSKWVDLSREARARKGVPIGARVFGRVRSQPSGGGVPGDPDRDGIPDPFDIDDDGDLLLDDFDFPTAPSAIRAGVAQAGSEILDVLTGLPLLIEGTANANAGSTDAQIEAALPSTGRVLMEILPGDSPELDCGGTPNQSPPPLLTGGLAYCSSGGTGTTFGAGGPPSAFPDCCDGDGDGFGTLTASPGSPPPPAVPFFFLAHGATTGEIGTGDVLVERVTRDGVETQFATVLQFVFATVPALVSYSDETGPPVVVSYPVDAPGPGGSPGGPGTLGNEFPVGDGADPDSDIELTVTFWRPQRRPIEGELCAPPDDRLCEPDDWIDIGGLAYSTIISHLGVPTAGTTVQAPCPQSAFSAGPDQPLTPTAAMGANPGFTDLTGDRPASPANTLTYTVNLSQCLASLGTSWSSGEELSVDFTTNVTRPGAGAGAQQSMWFKRP